jgi:hypothetical protein
MKVHCDFGLWPYFVVDDLILVICGFSRDIRVVYASLLFIKFWLFVESAGPLGTWVGTKVVDPLSACVKVTDCYIFCKYTNLH